MGDYLLIIITQVKQKKEFRRNSGISRLVGCDYILKPTVSIRLPPFSASVAKVFALGAATR